MIGAYLEFADAGCAPDPQDFVEHYPELAAGLRPHGVDFAELTGVSYNPLADKWSLSPDLDVNYMAVAARKANSDYST